jgi:hypothetical protein
LLWENEFGDQLVVVVGTAISRQSNRILNVTSPNFDLDRTFPLEFESELVSFDLIISSFILPRLA